MGGVSIAHTHTYTLCHTDRASSHTGPPVMTLSASASAVTPAMATTTQTVIAYAFHERARKHDEGVLGFESCTHTPTQ